MTVTLGTIGAFYGAETSSSLIGEIAFGSLYGFLGVCAAVPLAFAINISRNWLR